MDGIPGIFEMLVEDHLSVSRVNRSAFQYVSLGPCEREYLQ